MFQVSPTSKLAVKLIMLIATRSGDHAVAVDELSREFSVSRKYLQQILTKLQRSGLLKSILGKNGGYVLAKSADRITVLDVLKVMENDLNLLDCLRDDDSERCPRAKRCVTRRLWQKVRTEVEEFTKAITIRDLLETFNKFKVESYVYHI